MILLWDLAEVLQAPEPAIPTGSTSQTGRIVPYYTEELTVLDEHNRRSGWHDE
jgi:hypothetical protein